MDLCHMTTVRKKVELMKREFIRLRGDADCAEAVLGEKKSKLQEVTGMFVTSLGGLLGDPVNLT